MLSEEEITAIVDNIFPPNNQPLRRHLLEDRLIKICYDRWKDREAFEMTEQSMRIAEKELNRWHYVVNENKDAYEFIQPTDGINWYKPSQFGERYKTQLPIEYLMAHLDEQNLNYVFRHDPHPNRCNRIRDLIDTGYDPLAISPIRIDFYLCEKKFVISDGLHRLRVFHERKYPVINADLCLNWSFNAREPPSESTREKYEFKETLIHL